jgi:CBS domain-containing protein
MIPVALAASTAASVRIALVGGAPVFPLPEVTQPGGVALATYIGIGALMGVAAVLVTRLVYGVEDRFERLPVHWMWWPAIGAVAVGVVGWFVPRTLGVGYSNIEETVRGELGVRLLIVLCAAKFLSWVFALGSGTSGGTLAPLFTIGGALGALLGLLAAHLLPGHAIDPRIAALVGMAALFAGASRALLASVVFAFETTRQPLGLLPLLGGCAASYFVSCIAMPNSIMTEKLARRGVRVIADYAADFLDSVPVSAHATRTVVTLGADQLVGEVRRILASGEPGTQHQGFPIVDTEGFVLGVLTRRDLLDRAHEEGITLASLIRRDPIVVHPDHSLRDAADHMVRASVGRVLVVPRDAPRRVVGILTRSDLLRAHERRLEAAARVSEARHLRIRFPRVSS